MEITQYEPSVKTIKHDCGCTSETHREAWVQMCPEHEAETKAVHERWAAEHKASKQPAFEPASSRKLKVEDLK